MLPSNARVDINKISYLYIKVLNKQKLILFLANGVEINSQSESAEYCSEHCCYHWLHVWVITVCICSGLWVKQPAADGGRLRPLWNVHCSAVCPSQLAGHLLQVLRVRFG